MSTFNLTPQFSYKTTINFATVMTPFESGVIQTRAKWPQPIRRWELVWSHANNDEQEELRAFYRDHSGPADTFSYTPTEKVARPFLAATLGQTEQDVTDSLGARTRYAGYTWADDSGNETEICKELENDDTTSVLSISSGYALTVTVPEFPSGVTRAIVYVGTTSSTLSKTISPITTSGGTWTEPDVGYYPTGDEPPTANTLTETVTAHFEADSLDVIKNSAYDWTMTVAIVEVLQ